MKNITVTIPDDSYTRARVWAAERDTSISAVVRHILETLPGIKRASKAFPISNKLAPAPPPAPESELPQFSGDSVEPLPTASNP